MNDTLMNTLYWCQSRFFIWIEDIKQANCTCHTKHFKFLVIPILVQILMTTSMLPAISKSYKKALPGYKFKFPRDHASHEQYKTEWWYYTGHLETKTKKKYGFELTFFRVGLDPNIEDNDEPWSLKNVYLAHFAVTDLNQRKFFYSQKLNRRGLNVAGAKSEIPYVFNENWSMKFLGDKILLSAKERDYSLDLVLTPKKLPVVHGIDGVSQKASCTGCASHYYSFSKLAANGVIFANGKPESVVGQAWMDHEFGSNQLTEEQIGWDWFSIQLDNNTEIMLYVLRRKDGSIDKNSSGTIIYPDGSSKHLKMNDFEIKTNKIWKSSKTKGAYPVAWNIKILKENIELQLVSLLDNQELVTEKSTGVVYWEGAVSVDGNFSDKAVKGNAYVEMTGYSEPFKQRI